MTSIADLHARAGHALANPDAPLLDPASHGELAPLAHLLNELIAHNRELAAENRNATNYIRDKVNQLLTVMGTLPLRPEEIDDKTIILTDPIGIVAESFTQILRHLRLTNTKLEVARDEIQAIFEAAGAGIMVLDNSGRILSCNHAFKRMFVLGEQSPEGKPCREFLCQGQASLLASCPHQRMLHSGQTTVIPESSLRGQQLTIVASPIKDKSGAITHGVLLFTDISLLKEAKRELAAEKERLRITLRSLAEGVITTDTEGKVVLLNEVAEQLTGWSQEEARGQAICDIFWLVTDRNRRECINITAETLRHGRFTLDKLSDAILVHRDGNERWVTLNSTTIQAAAGDIHGIVMAFRDITAEKTMEAEIHKARKIESLGVLAGGLAHDFNNILTAIFGNISLARMLSPPQSPAADKLAQAEKACQRAQGLTQQLLTFAKGGAPIRKTTSVAELIRETALFSLRGSNVGCDLHINPDLWLAYIDEGQISQVINNMVINADQAMTDGGAIIITAENCAITDEANLPLKAGNYIVITIADSGCGISRQTLEQIFDPYFTTKAHGNGLGLASCYAIIKKHEGHIAVLSTEGQGTTFTVYLPARPQERPASRQQTTPLPALLGPLKILVMDDEAMLRELTCSMLSQLGCRVVDTAADGDEALHHYRQAMAANAPYDLVILDLTIPGGMGGQETLAQLLKIDPGCRAVVSSGYSNDAAMASYHSLGFKAVIPKPYAIDQLIATIKSVAPEAAPAAQS